MMKTAVYDDKGNVVVQAQPIPYGYGSDGVNMGKATLVQLDTTALRHDFIRKVYTILCFQLAVTFGFVAFFSLSEAAIDFIQENPAIFYASIFIAFACVIVLSCFTSVARSYPYGMIFLAVFTLAESVLIGVLAANFDVIDILIAVGATGLIVIGLTFFACQTKYDFTGMGPYLFVALLTVVIFMFVLIFLEESRTVRVIFAIIVVLLFSCYLVYDTQLLLGGNHKVAFEVDEHVFAALSLYLDIINIFIYLLIIIGGGDR